MAMPVLMPTLSEPFAQLDQAAALLAGLLQLLLHCLAFLAQRRPHFLVLPPCRLRLGLESGAVLSSLFAQLQKLLAALVQMGGQLFFLAFQRFAALFQL